MTKLDSKELDLLDEILQHLTEEAWRGRLCQTHMPIDDIIALFEKIEAM